jgi:hypothetical protein
MSDFDSKQSNSGSVKTHVEAQERDQSNAEPRPLHTSVSANEISKSWTSFEAKVPLTYLVAARKAAREKNS